MFEWLRHRLIPTLFRPVDIAGLVYVRIAFGLLMMWEVWRYHAHDRIFRYWIEPEHHFPYPGFSWLSPLPGDGMYHLFIALGVSAFLITIGLFYRIAAALFAVGFTYMFLLEQGRYLNHFYLISLVSFILVFLPAHRAFSLDSLIGWTRKTTTVPAWTIVILRFQLAVVYFFGGIAKLNADWLAGEPMREWLSRRTDKPVVGPWLDSEWVVFALSWGGLLFDLLIPFLLLYRRTRAFAFIAAVIFHLANAFLWTIGIFPWFAIALTAVFFPTDWPRRIVRLPTIDLPAEMSLPRLRNVTVCLLAVFCFTQIAMPLRHWIYPGNVAWTEEGHRFSWRMKLRSRDGRTDFFIIETWGGTVHDVDPDDFLEPWQVRKMDTNPEMILHFARILKSHYQRVVGLEVSVHADSQISVNGRPDQPFFNIGFDLSSITAQTPRHHWLNEFDASPTRRDFALDKSGEAPNKAIAKQ